MTRAEAPVPTASFPRTVEGEAEAWAYRSEREDPVTGRAPSLTFEPDRIDVYEVQEEVTGCGSA
jgi:hypothetical protein